VGRQAAVLLRERHHLNDAEDDDFNIRNPEDQIQTALAASNTFTIFLICIGSVSLLVGGIGIMNVMLVSVTERTREIGLRMAVGATGLDVQFQFLAEALALSLIGGVLGVLLGIAGSVALGHSLRWSLHISSGSVLVAALFAMSVGILFGYWPARKAAMLDPIEALRYE
jgi:putative ABC transport system permease protein